MKIIELIIVCLSIILASQVQGQVSVGLKVGVPPAWGPAGYSGVKYYYIPDLEVYYDVHKSDFIYFSDKKWVRNVKLPTHFKRYNLFRIYKVPIQNYSGKFPHYFFKQHKSKYAKGYKGKFQKNVGINGSKNAKQLIQFQKEKNKKNASAKKRNSNSKHRKDKKK